MEKLPIASRKPRPSVLFLGDSRMRQLQVALYRELTGRINQMQLAINEDYCDLPNAHNLTWYSEVLQSCRFNRTVLPYNFGIERWWAPFFKTTMVAADIQRILALPDDQTPNLIIINAGLWQLRECFQQKTSFQDCYQSYQGYVSNA
jgi:hypothetical protein